MATCVSSFSSARASATPARGSPSSGSADRSTRRCSGIWPCASAATCRSPTTWRPRTSCRRTSRTAAG
eukprot:5365681-Alexandrium_andersonii.AAC.1